VILKPTFVSITIPGYLIIILNVTGVAGLSIPSIVSYFKHIRQRRYLISITKRIQDLALSSSKRIDEESDELDEELAYA
jgi:hypothetical protein